RAPSATTMSVSQRVPTPRAAYTTVAATERTATATPGPTSTRTRMWSSPTGDAPEPTSHSVAPSQRNHTGALHSTPSTRTVPPAPRRRWTDTSVSVHPLVGGVGPDSAGTWVRTVGAGRSSRLIRVV